jgi:hypothetical protein
MHAALRMAAWAAVPLAQRPGIDGGFSLLPVHASDARGYRTLVVTVLENAEPAVPPAVVRKACTR